MQPNRTPHPPPPNLPLAGRTRLLYRMSLDFLHWTKAVPGIGKFWEKIAGQVGAGRGASPGSRGCSRPLRGNTSPCRPPKHGPAALGTLFAGGRGVACAVCGAASAAAHLLGPPRPCSC